MAKLKMLTIVSTSAILAITSLVAVAGTSSNSPFASKKKKAWETAPAALQAPAPDWTQSGTGYNPPSYSQPTQAVPDYYSVPQTQTPQAQNPLNQPYQPPSGGSSYQYPSSNYQASPAYTNTAPNTVTAPRGYKPYNQPQTQQPTLRGASNAGYNNYGNQGYAKPPLKERFGWGNVQTDFSGTAMVGVAAVDRPGSNWGTEVVADLDVRGEISAITEGGLEYGAGLRVRAQRDRFRRGFGGRVGDCPATNPACASALVGANTRPVKGHTGQFYTQGAADRTDAQFALEGAYVFLRSSYGDFVVGRDDGAAYLFSLGAPSVVAVNASNSRVDYTGLDSVKTVNDASGFATKIAYTTPRLLGDTVGVGVQLGVSYAPTSKACGVDYCVEDNGILATDIFAPEIEDVIEVGLSLDRNFGNGVSAEFTTTYARGSEKTGNVAFDNLSSWGAGLEVKYSDFVFGSSYLKSNNGFAGDGDYTAYDVGLTWQPNQWGFGASYGHATDDIAQLSSDQVVLAVSHDFGKFSLGSGVQYIKRKTPTNLAGIITPQSDDATAIFIEGSVEF